MDKAKGLTKNPLGIIALFISLLYGFACLVLGLSGINLTHDERIPLIYFLIIFPGLILLAFYCLVAKHHKKLYAPSDFKDERHFHGVFEKPQKHTGQKPSDTKVADGAIDSLLKWSSITGLFGLYAAYLSKVKNRPFTTEDLATHSNLLTPEYIHGFIVATSSLGMFTLSSQSEPFQIINMNKELEEKLKDHVYKLAKTHEDSSYLLSQLANIENAFATE